MLKVNVGDSKELSVERKGKDLLINGEIFDCQIERLSETRFNIYKSGKIYSAEVDKVDRSNIQLIIDGKAVKVAIETSVDQLLKELGMNDTSSSALKDVKAPMPGTILSVAVEAGQHVSTSEPLLILEAMKMENVIKSPGEGVVKDVEIKTGDNVEKNQVLISFE